MSGIPTGTIFKWIKELTPVVTEDGKTVTSKEVKALEKRIRELETENEIQKKRPPYSQENLKRKVDFSKLFEHIYPIKMMCKVPYLNRSTVYKILMHQMSDRDIRQLEFESKISIISLIASTMHQRFEGN